MIQDIAETIQSFADNKWITITKEIQDNLSEIVLDKERIKQVILTLLNNAIVFSPESSTINIRVNEEPDEMLFEGRNFGDGILNNKQKKISYIFNQMDSGMNHHFAEISLGPTISQGIFLSHGGKIWIESEGEKGNIFQFAIPIKAVHDLG